MIYSFHGNTKLYAKYTNAIFGNNNQKQINNNRATPFERTAA